MSNCDLLLIHPGAAHGIYGVLGDQLIAVEPPLWCRLIAGYVRDRGFKVEIIDAEALQWSPQVVADYTKNLNPRLVCIAVYGHQPSASTQQMVGASATAKAIKKLGAKAPVIMCGGHVSALPEQTLREEAVDFVCTGEGPVTILGLLSLDAYNYAHGYSNLENIPGLAWFSSVREYQSTPDAPLIEDLNELHGSVWDMLPMELYRAHNWQCFGDLSRRQPYASIYTSLGCPYKCSFCCINAPFHTNRYRMRDPKVVVNEIVYLYMQHGVKTFKIVDEMFVLNKHHYTSIALRLADLNLKDLNIWAYARVDTVEPSNLALLRAAGIRWLALGIESGSKYVRDGSNKRLKNDDIVGVVRSIQAADINVIGNYIFGLPDDTLGSMQETLDLALECRTEFSNFYSAMAYPGSPLHREAVAKGWTLPETWRGYSQHNDDCRPLDTLHISGAEVLRFRDAAFNVYFSNPEYRTMVESKFGRETLDHINDMLKYKLKRKLLAAA